MRNTKNARDGFLAGAGSVMTLQTRHHVVKVDACHMTVVSFGRAHRKISKASKQAVGMTREAIAAD